MTTKTSVSNNTLLLLILVTIALGFVSHLISVVVWAHYPFQAEFARASFHNIPGKILMVILGTIAWSFLIGTASFLPTFLKALRQSPPQREAELFE